MSITRHSLEQKIAIRMFNEYHNRIGILVGQRPRKGMVNNIIAFGVMCIEIGKSLEQDALNEYLIGRDHKSDCNEQVRDALQSAEDEHGIEQHLASPQSQP